MVSFRSVLFLFVYILCGGALGAVVGRIIIQFTNQEIFMVIFAIVVCMVIGIVVASKINRVSNRILLVGIIGGALFGFLTRNIFADIVTQFVHLLGVNVYINPVDISSFGTVYGAAFGVLIGILSFILVSLGVNIEIENSKNKSGVALDNEKIQDNKKIALENPVHNNVDSIESHQHQVKNNTKPQEDVAIKPQIDPYYATLNSPNGIALALGAKVSTKCNKILESDTILLLTHLFAQATNIVDFGKYNSIDEIYQDILDNEKNNFSNINLLCLNLKRLDVALEDKMQFIKSLLLIGLEGEHFNDDVIFQIALNIGVGTEDYFSLKKELESSLADLANDVSIGIDIEDVNVAYTKDELVGLYAILEVSPNDSNSKIKKSYRRLAAKYHPDKYASKELPEDMVKFAEERFKDINYAYDILRKHRNIH